MKNATCFFFLLIVCGALCQTTINIFNQATCNKNTTQKPLKEVLIKEEIADFDALVTLRIMEMILPGEKFRIILESPMVYGSKIPYTGEGFFQNADLTFTNGRYETVAKAPNTEGQIGS